MDLEALLANPHVAAIAKKAKEYDDKVKAEKEAGGDWEKLAREREVALTEAQKQLGIKDDIIGKYKGSTKNVLDNLLKTIPDDKKALIPADYSERQQLEYIIGNASFFGAKPIVGGGGVPPNDPPPAVTAEDTLVKEIDELVKKGATRTLSETNAMIEKSGKLKALRIENAKKA